MAARGTMAKSQAKHAAKSRSAFHSSCLHPAAGTMPPWQPVVCIHRCGRA